MGEYDQIFKIIYALYQNSLTGQTRWRIFTHNGSNNVDSHKDVPFGGFVDIAPHLGGEIPHKLQFLAHK